MVRSTFTTITPLPASIAREVVLDFLHDHLEMIDNNPLVIERHPIEPPSHAPPEELRCAWYSLTDKVSYLPGGLWSGQVVYSAAFHNLPEGLQTHVYAPMGLHIRGRWSVGGTLPGEPPEPVEIGLNVPPTGLYLREDVDMRCNTLMSAFVKKTLKNSHGSLVDRLVARAQRQGKTGTRPGSLTPSAVNHGSVSPPRLDSLGISTATAESQLEPSSNTSQSDLPRHSGTVYRGNSRPHDYDELSRTNPYTGIGGARAAAELNGGRGTVHSRPSTELDNAANIQSPPIAELDSTGTQHQAPATHKAELE